MPYTSKLKQTIHHLQTDKLQHVRLKFHVKLYATSNYVLFEVNMLIRAKYTS
uniref:Uncharacterized protein n=1 Tax=Arundo donax TaxID=35708 RepID=A0A0A8YG62_ARUDO